MERSIYRRANTKDWPDFVADKYSDFLSLAYSGEPLEPGEDKHAIIWESIDSDLIFELEEGGEIIGYTAVKLLPTLGPNIIFVREIAVSPEQRGRGLSGELRYWMNEELKPEIILGVAQNPISVITRARAFDSLGFQTFWANRPVTDYENPIDLQTVAFWSHRFAQTVFPQHMDHFDDGLLPYTDTEIAAEPVAGLSPFLARTLDRLLLMQTKLGMPAMGTLVSLKRE